MSKNTFEVGDIVRILDTHGAFKCPSTVSKEGQVVEIDAQDNELPIYQVRLADRFDSRGYFDWWSKEKDLELVPQNRTGKFKVGDVVKIISKSPVYYSVSGKEGVISELMDDDDDAWCRINIPGFPNPMGVDWYVPQSSVALMNPNEDTLPVGSTAALAGVVGGTSPPAQDGLKEMRICNRYTTASNAEDTYVSPTGALRKSVGKPDLSYIPLDLLDGAAKVLEFGAKKYARNNYRNGFPPLHVLASLLRHTAQLQQALEQEDKDGSKCLLNDVGEGGSQEAHVHHVVVNALFLVDSMRKAGYRV